MRKKLKDLTEEDIERICKSHYYCDECPLYNKAFGCLMQNSEVEIEVPEE